MSSETSCLRVNNMPATAIQSRLRDWAFTQLNEEAPEKKLLKSIVRIAIIVTHVFFKTHISLRASALTYSIILSLVPILAMSTAILKGLGSDNDLKIAAYHLIDQIVPATELSRAGGPGLATSPKDVTAEQGHGNATMPETGMADHLRNAVDMIFDYVDRTNFAALGAFGIIGLLFVVLLMLSNIESTMNVIWHSAKSRPLGRKIMDYLALLVLLPISLNTAIAGGAILQSRKMMGYITTIIPSEWLVKMLLKGLPFLFIVGCLTFIYQFFPYAKVKTYAALIGALFSSFCWFIVLQLYIGLQIGVSKYNAIYGSFATVPLFLIWLHLGWIFLLLGAALAYAVQNRNRHTPGLNGAITPKHCLQLAIDILQQVYINFARHRTTGIGDLAASLPKEPVARLVEISMLLIKGGLLHRVAGSDDLTMTPAQPLERLKAKDILTLVLGKDSANSVGGRLSDEMIKIAGSGLPHPLFPVNER